MFGHIFCFYSLLIKAFSCSRCGAWTGPSRSPDLPLLCAQGIIIKKKNKTKKKQLAAWKCKGSSSWHARPESPVKSAGTAPWINNIPWRWRSPGTTRCWTLKWCFTPGQEAGTVSGSMEEALGFSCVDIKTGPTTDAEQTRCKSIR